MSNEDWKNWNEPAATSAVVVWTNQNGKLRMATHAGDWWYLTASSYARTWPELLSFINTVSAGTPLRIVPLDEPEAPKPETEAAPEPERVVVWKTGDPFDKLLPYAGKEGVEARAERGKTVMVGPVGVGVGVQVPVGDFFLPVLDWTMTVTAPKPVAPWWQIKSIERGHVVSWKGIDGETPTIIWYHQDTLDNWRRRWDAEADPTTWRITDVHATSGPKLIAGAGA